MAGEAPGSTPLALGGWQVDCCCVAEDVRLLFLYPPPGATELDTFEVSLRTPFVIDVRGKQHLLDPTGPRACLAPLLALYGRAVKAASVSSDGTLSMTFADGAMLVVEPDLILEAWELTGPRQTRVICLPGGDGAVWFEWQPAAVG
jgi:Family of unknown function (DUF6188)